MPFGAVKLVPGVNVEKTPTLLEAGYIQSQLIRFRDGLAQKYGGFIRFYPFLVDGVPRDLHAWSDLNSVNHLLVGTTTQLSVITEGSQQDITPQTLISDFAPNFDTDSGSPIIEVTDPNISNVSVYDAVLFNTPVSVGAIILSGIYPIATITGANSYTIVARSNADGTDGGVVPDFTTSSASAIVNVELPDHAVAVGAPVVFQIPTTGNGVTIDGAYTVNSVVDADNFTITTATTATAGGSFDMNGGDAELVYYISLGPPPGGTGYGIGPYGVGGYGTGVVNPNQSGDPITAADWTSDNWGQLALACPQDGGIYYWDPNGGFINATLINTGPIFNRGIFVSTSQQILIAYGSTIDETTNGGFGLQQDPMLISWCDSGNLFVWTATDTNLAGNFRIPIGSTCVAGMAVANQNLIWTDLDLWVMGFIGYPDTYGFNKIGAGAGTCSSHAVQALRDGVYWMGRANFYGFRGGSVSVLPCPIWDFVFQNINTAFFGNVRAMPNTPFNEAGWFFPSLASTNGENDSYAKMNISEPGAPWDHGALARSAWIDLTVLGHPIGASSDGVIYQHETGNDAAGGPLPASFTTGYFYLSEGEDFVFVDQVFPDMVWGDYPAPKTAQIQITFLVVDFAGGAPRTYGPYTVIQGTPYISVRFRGRQVAIQVQSSDLGSFWRLGKIRFRFAISGRR